MKYATEQWKETKLQYLKEVNNIANTIGFVTEKIKRECGQDFYDYFVWNGSTQLLEELMSFCSCLVTRQDKAKFLIDPNTKEYNRFMSIEYHWPQSLKFYKNAVMFFKTITPEKLELDWAEYETIK